MGRAWRWWGVAVVVGVCLVGGVRGVAECLDTVAKGREWKPGAKGQDWTWKDRDRCVRTRDELLAILGDHRLWLYTRHKQGHRADLSGAHLRNADLSGADLSGADLSGADLWSADLSGEARLNEADLSGAKLTEADLTGAQLTKADLTGAQLTEAKLTVAHPFGADFTGAVLNGADLSGADLTKADLSEAYFYAARLDGAIYEPSAQPLLETVAYANGLDRLRYASNPAPLVELRKAFEDAGFVQQGRKVTAVLHRSALAFDRKLLSDRYESNMENLSETSENPVCGDPWLLRCRIRSVVGPVVRSVRFAVELLPIYVPRVLFDWTCAWGADWSHPLVLLGWLCLVCGPVYWVGMHFGRVGGIYQIVLDKVVATKDAKEVVTRVGVGVHWVGRERLRRRAVRADVLVAGQPEEGASLEADGRLGEGPGERAGGLPEGRPVGVAGRARSGRLRGRLVGMALRAEWRAVRLAFLFSVLSALDIGFHEFNVGQWARLVLAREFNLKARGWMRVAGGVQSLVGLGLVALSLLSYFGHPFD